jgi:hypothetical protein
MNHTVEATSMYVKEEKRKVYKTTIQACCRLFFENMKKPFFCISIQDDTFKQYFESLSLEIKFEID